MISARRRDSLGMQAAIRSSDRQVGRRVLWPDRRGATKNGKIGFERLGVRRVVPGFREVNRLVKRFLLEIGQDQRAPTVQWSALRVHGVRGRQGLVRLFIVVQSQRDLLQVVDALAAACGRPCATSGR